MTDAERRKQLVCILKTIKDAVVVMGCLDGEAALYAPGPSISSVILILDSIKRRSSPLGRCKVAIITCGRY